MDSDFETGGAPDEELGLPKATVAKLIQEMMPGEIACAKETRDLLSECCVEFIHLIASEANEACEKDAKKTIAGEHVIAALKTLGFDEYVAEVTEVYEEHAKQLKDREKRSSKLEDSGIPEEELLKQQEELFARARQNYQDGQTTFQS
ncbi:negative cofactor 2 transcription regulator complex subunit ncb2 [Dinochytrium kinnereticum]|nr:negative cofactor 2 transcription regulator complex subunit ncb2 [Dinochytrium kinnereticum]